MNVYQNSAYTYRTSTSVTSSASTSSSQHRNQRVHLSGQQDVFYHQSSAAYDYPYPVPPSAQPPVVYSRHHGGDVAPLIDQRDPHIPPLPTTQNRVHARHPPCPVIPPETRYERPRQDYLPSPPIEEQGVKRTRSTSNATKPRRRRSSQASFTGPASRNRKVIYDDPRCVMLSAHGTPLGPSNHIIVSQQAFFDEPSFDSPRQNSISFQLTMFPELGVRLSTALGGKATLVGGEDMFFIKNIYKEIKLRIIWPGYSRYPFERRVKTRDLDRSHLLMAVSKAIADFIKHIWVNDIPVDHGFERWKVGFKSSLITIEELFVTGLIHRGGSNWQPEIWCPSGRVQT